MISKIRSYILGSQEVKSNFLFLVAVIMGGPIILGIFNENKKTQANIGEVNRNYISRGIYNLKVYATSEYLRKISMLFNNTDFYNMFVYQYLKGKSVENFCTDEMVDHMILKDFSSKINFNYISEKEINRKIKDTDFFRKYLMINLPHEVFTKDEKIDQKMMRRIFSHLNIKQDEFEEFIKDSINKFFLESLLRNINFPILNSIGSEEKKRIKFHYIEYSLEDDSILSSEEKEADEVLLKAFHEKKSKEGFFLTEEERTISGWKIKKEAGSEAGSKEKDYSKISAEIRIVQQEDNKLEDIMSIAKKYNGEEIKNEDISLKTKKYEEILQKIFNLEKSDRFYTIDAPGYVYVLKIMNIKPKEIISFEKSRQDVKKLYLENLITKKIVEAAEKERKKFEESLSFDDKRFKTVSGGDSSSILEKLNNLAVLRDGMTFLDKKDSKITLYGISSAREATEETKSLLKAHKEGDFCSNFIVTLKKYANIKLY